MIRPMNVIPLSGRYTPRTMCPPSNPNRLSGPVDRIRLFVDAWSMAWNISTSTRIDLHGVNKFYGHIYISSGKTGVVS